MIDYKKHLTIQSYGTNLMLFINGKDDSEAYSIWLALFNMGAVGELEAEPNWVNYGVYSCWVTPARLKHYFFTRRIFALTDNGASKFKGKKGGVVKEAQRLAELDYASINKDSYRSANVIPDEYCFGQISAEKPDSTFEDACWASAMAKE